jgi:FkbM family methyltransferase
MFLRRPDVREAPVRLLSRRLLLALMDVVAPSWLAKPRTFRLSSGLRVTVPLNDTVGRELFIHGSFEWTTMQVWKAAAARGGTVVDVGAHIGSFTLEAAQLVGPTGRVIAVEPDPTNRARLVHNLSINGLTDRVTVVEAAMLDEECQLPLGSPSPNNSGMTRLNSGDQLVQCRRLDDVLDELGAPTVDAIKIDVEGFEPAVLRGAAKMVARDRPLVIAEVNDAEVLSALRDCGYALALPDGRPFPADTAIGTWRHDGEALNVVARVR